MTEESIFAEALAIGSPRERAAFLDRVCDDDAMRKEVEALLAAHTASNPLDQPPDALARTGVYEPDGPPVAEVGDTVGPYRLMEQIGQGGFGLVFVAEQSEPVRRKVALKVLKPGMDTRDVVARFEAERQALALMDHPNIARVFDAGSTAQGRPYFAMELVRGLPITDYCDSRKLPTAERLALFVKVCQAVQHAHQKGVIHRDLKPSNVLVTMIDGEAVPKVIDFGVAKAVGQSLTEKTIYTRFAQIVGTPLYMSPEQAEMSGVDVDTRADVYALGVLLYELLTGTTPFDRARFSRAAFDEMRRIIREEEPPRPSTRLSSLGDTLTSVSSRRGTDPARLAGLVRGELDWIAMRCLEKDRNRRYDSATALAKDVQRHLDGDAVEACPPTWGYRLRKTYRRNRAAVLIGGAFAVVLLVATVVSGWLAVKASLAEERAEAKRIEAVENATQAENESNARAYTLGVLSVREEQLRLALATSAIDKLSLQIDLDLAEVSTDSRTGLLRLAKTLVEAQAVKVPLWTLSEPAPDDPQLTEAARLADLRSFVTAAVLTTGQNYAPLRRPITHDGFPPTLRQATPEGRTLLTEAADGTVRLWNVASGTSIALLREQRERVKQSGLSPDGRTAFTTDEDGVVRLWDVPEGKFRGKTDPWSGSERDHRVRPVKMSNHRLLTMGARGKEDVVELRDTRTGRKIADLDRDHFRPFLFQRFSFTGGDRYLIGNTDRERPVPVLHVFSADTGAEVGRLLPPVVPGMAETKFRINSVDASPSGKRFAAHVQGDGSSYYWFWSVSSWEPSPVAQFASARSGWIGVSFRTEDVLDMTDELSKYVIRFGSGEEQPLHRSGLLPAAGDVLCDRDGLLLDARTGQRLYPPPGRRYHPDLARFAPDGRLVNTADLIDVRADKPIAIDHSLRWSPMDQSLRFFPGSGFVVAEDPSRVLRTTDIDIPPKLLNLWAQVAVCGELGPDGSFMKWKEETWDRKRRELAASSAPIADFPFPGHAATDKLHWLRSEYEEAKTEQEKLRIARDLLSRCELAGDPEAARWRMELERHAAPPPREAKP